MKKILFAFAIAGVMAGCSKNPEKVLPKKDGKWKWTGTVVSSGSGVSVTVNMAGTATFTESGYTTKVSTIDGNACTSGCDDSGSWKYDKDAEKITLTSSSAGSTAETYVVSDMKTKSETWTQTETDQGVTTTTTMKLEADR